MFVRYSLRMTGEYRSVSETPLIPGSRIVVPPGARFELLDANGKPAGQQLTLRTEGADLLLIQDGELLARLEGFHTPGQGAQLEGLGAQGELTTLAVSEAPGVQGGAIWQAAGGSSDESGAGGDDSGLGWLAALGGALAIGAAAGGGGGGGGSNDDGSDGGDAGTGCDTGKGDSGTDTC